MSVKSESVNFTRNQVVILGSGGFIGKSLLEFMKICDLFSVQGISSSDINLTDKTHVKSKLPELIRDKNIIITAAITRDKGDSPKGMLNNIKMYSNIATVLSDVNINHLIYFSTVDIYGKEHLVLPLNESSKIQPSNYYAISKLIGEFIFNKICSDKHIPFTILRLPRVYGPNDPNDSVISIFIKSAINKKKIKVNGDGLQRRDFLYINDINEIVKMVISQRITGTYNIVTGRCYAINKIVDFIESFFKYPINIEYLKNNKDIDLVFEKSKILEMLNGFTFTDLKDGLEQTYNFYCTEKS